MDEHQGRKSEIDAREEKIASVLATGEQMIEKEHFASNEVSPSFLDSNFKSLHYLKYNYAMVSSRSSWKQVISLYHWYMYDDDDIGHEEVVFDIDII